ncbi:MAG: hypothetical protein ACYCVL_05765 [Gemmatimonadaceae bacterium]
MSTHNEAIHDKIDGVADSAKHTAEKAIDGVAGVTHRAAEKTAEHAHDAGKHLKDAGEKIMKKADGK